MGQLLEENYRNMDVLKGFAKINKFLDEDYQKLSDKVKDLELSHNRMRKLLKMTLKMLESEFYLEDMQYLHRRITLELYGLENYKGLKGGRK